MFVEVSSTKRLSVIRPSRTPKWWSMWSLFSIPGPPFGTTWNSSPLMAFCSGQLNGQWSVETAERASDWSAFQRCSWCSFGRGGGV